MKKLLFLSALLVFAISASYAGNFTNNSKLVKRLVMNQRLLTGLSHANYSVVTHKMRAHVRVTEHTFLNNLRLNARLITGFLNTTLYGTLQDDYGSDPEYGETWSYDVDVDVDNEGMIHETDTLTIPSGGFPTGFVLSNSQIHVYLSYYANTYGDTNLSPYVEHFDPGWYGDNTVAYDYPAADLAAKQILLDWGGSGGGIDIQPARNIDISYPF